VSDWDRYLWADQATEATLAVVASSLRADEFLGRLGATDAQGAMTLDSALELQGRLYDDGSFDKRAVFQAEKLTGESGDWWATVEPNGFRARSELGLLALAAGSEAVSFFWNVNAVMAVLRMRDGRVAAAFDPLLDTDEVPEEGRDLPFEQHPRAASIALVERWTGVSIQEEWFAGSKPTYIVHAPLR
jgi:hypothetical protein